MSSSEGRQFDGTLASCTRVLLGTVETGPPFEVSLDLGRRSGAARPVALGLQLRSDLGAHVHQAYDYVDVRKVTMPQLTHS